MSAYKKLNANDVKITPFEAHKSYEVSNANSASLGVTIHQTSWTNTTKDAYTDANRRYFQLDHLYYKDYFTSLGNRLDIEDRDRDGQLDHRESSTDCSTHQCNWSLNHHSTLKNL